MNCMAVRLRPRIRARTGRCAQARSADAPEAERAQALGADARLAPTLAPAPERAVHRGLLALIGPGAPGEAPGLREARRRKGPRELAVAVRVLVERRLHPAVAAVALARVGDHVRAAAAADGVEVAVHEQVAMRPAEPVRVLGPVGLEAEVGEGV